ncbi:MAG: ATP-dependent DNA helicase RecG, partial [bacterium]|nr:ATP-dependent DNA helicase RecG [bacterium]
FIRLKYGLSNLKEAIKKVHFPRYLEDTIEARIRLGFDEFFGLQLNSLLKKKVWDEKKNAPSLLVDKEKIASFVKSLPFELTASQKVACQEILQNLQKSTAMNRMLEGDVGSGKTIVAAIACYVAFLNGYQSAIMAPTQILATQHFNTLTKILSPLGVKISLILGGSSLKVEDRSADIFIGTHALLQKEDYFNKLGFIVIDEQHRFGVSQRAKLAAKTNELSPHVLTMTATPIPRTVALTAYGDLDVSVLTELPKGRVKIKTWVVPPKKREAAYGWIRSRVQGTDEQAFIVCPLIEQSEAESLTSVKAATVEYEKLSKEVFPDLKLGLLHGRIKGKEKDEIMAKFKNGELDILVATPVVEVGIDIPGATIIMIEAAERFGLAQLHQLRGRVGRGSKQSYCLLFTESSAITAQTRLKALERSTNGLELAELDLKMRGPGEIYGIAQHGYPELKVANYNDLSLIKKARSAAESLVDQLEKYPKVQEFIKVSSTPIAQN